MRRPINPLLCCILLATSFALHAEDKPDPRIALDSAFPDATQAKDFAGELILIEHVNRLGILRLDRDGTINNYHWDLPHQFQMLPYGAITYRGAPANLEDIPLGTHLHGRFYLGPEGDFKVDVPDTGYTAGKMANPDMRSTVSQYSRVLSLADDFSFSSAKGEGWKVTAFGDNRSTISVERVTLADGSPARSGEADQGVKSKQVLRLDCGTRIWKGRQFAALEDLAIGQIVQLNLGWVTLLGSTKQDGLCRDIWIDEESRQFAKEQQRHIYIASMKRLGVPATIFKTEHVHGEGARGYITFAFHAGVVQNSSPTFNPKAPSSSGPPNRACASMMPSTTASPPAIS